MTEEELENKGKQYWLHHASFEASLSTVRAYIAGAKENQPNTEEMLKRLSEAGIITRLFTWHKVADGDLPDNTDSVLSDKGVIVYYNFTHACWVDERASVEIDDVIAWCEIPEYTEE